MYSDVFFVFLNFRRLPDFDFQHALNTFFFCEKISKGRFEDYTYRLGK